MIDDPVLVNDWHVVARSSDVGDSDVAAARLLGEDVVVWRRAGEVGPDGVISRGGSRADRWARR